jgi:lipoprotein-releasing system permease protein
LGIFLGTVALTLVLCVMQGFEQTTQEKLQSISPTIMIRARSESINSQIILNILAREFPEIQASAQNMQQFVMIQDPHAKALSTVATLKAIDPAQEARVTALQSMIIMPKNMALTELVYDNRVLIGTKLAQQLNLKPGNTMTLWYTADDQHATLQKASVAISGIFKTGLEEYDLNMIFTNLTFAQELFPDESIDEIGIKLKPAAAVAIVTQKLKKRFNMLEVVSWHELYPALVSALKLEKYAMFFIIMLITLVASMNIISLIFMQITQKRRDIAILQTYGMKNTHIRALFFCIGLFIGLGGALSGLAVAGIIGTLLYTYPCISLPDIYYTTHLPIILNPFLFIIVFITVLVITIIATIIPLKDISRINIAHILRFDG